MARPDRGYALGADRPLFTPGKATKPRVQPPAVAEPSSVYVLETGAGYLGLEWHSDVMLHEDSE